MVMPFFVTSSKANRVSTNCWLLKQLEGDATDLSCFVTKIGVPYVSLTIDQKVCVYARVFLESVATNPETV